MGIPRHDAAYIGAASFLKFRKWWRLHLAWIRGRFLRRQKVMKTRRRWFGGDKERHGWRDTWQCVVWGGRCWRELVVEARLGSVVVILVAACSLEVQGWCFWKSDVMAWSGRCWMVVGKREVTVEVKEVMEVRIQGKGVARWWLLMANDGWSGLSG